LSCNDNVDTKSINAEDDTITKVVDKLIICSEGDTTEEKVESNKIMCTYEQKLEHTNADIIDVPEVCANCGKEGSDLNTCNRCKLVKYCNATCKKKHRSKHKKKCDRRVAELHDEKLFKEHPPNEECPICLVPMPHEEDHQTYRACCGKTICNGCVHRMKMVELSNIDIDEIAQTRGSEVPESLKGYVNNICPFCRAPASSIEENNKRIQKLVENGNAEACHNLGIKYAKGKGGVSQDYTKANELYLKGGELGCADAYNNLGASILSGYGVEEDEKKARACSNEWFLKCTEKSCVYGV